MNAIRRKPLCVVTALMTLLLATSAGGITINMEYTDEGDTPPHPENPTWDPDGTILKNHFNAAKAIWEYLLPGGGEYSFDFHWDNDIDGLGLYTPGPDEYIEINPDFDWFADFTPEDDVEFNLRTQTLYSGLSTSDQSTYFPGTAPPGALEVGYRGTGLGNMSLVNGIPVNTLSASGQVLPGTMTRVDASNGNDLLSTVLHEIGHALGLSGIEPGDYNIDPIHVGGVSNVLVLEGGGGHLAGQGAIPYLMCESCGTRGVRRFATATDVLVIAEDQGITVVQLARVGRISGGLWSESDRWIGGDAPDISQDVYVSHGGNVTVDVPAQARSLLVAPGNSFHIQTGRSIAVDGTLTYTGGALSAAGGGTITAKTLVGDPGSLTAQLGSLVRLNQLTGNTSSTANFGGSLAFGYYLGFGPTESSTVPYDPSTLPTPITTWNIGQHLRIGDLNAARLVVKNATWSVSDDLIVGGTLGSLSVQTSGAMTVGGNLDIGKNGDVSIESGGALNVTGDVFIGSAGKMNYRSDRTAANATYEIRGGGTSIFTPPTGAPELSHTAGGALAFEETANAASATINVDGGAGSGAPPGLVVFRGNASAATAHFRTKGGQRGPTLPIGFDVAGDGGQVRFEGTSRAGATEGATPMFINEGGAAYFGGSGGRTIFTGHSSAVRATLHNHGATFVNAGGGATQFFGNATAASASITNHADGTYNAADTLGATAFFDSSAAGRATIENLGSPNQTNSPGRTEFRGRSSAANAAIYSRGFLTPGGLAGRTLFFDESTADFATIHIYEGYSDAGRVEFHDQSKAAFAHIFVNNVPSIVGSNGNGGHVIFHDDASAEDARITLRENACCNGVQFYNNAQAARASFIQENGSGNIAFWNNSRANDATFLVGEGAGVAFYDQSRADGAIFNLANLARLSFVNDASAGHAQIVADGGAVYTAGAQAVISFISNATADNAAITVNGATAPLASSAYLSFTGGASAGNATLTANGGSNGGVGATIVFNGAANGSTARLIANAGGLVDFFDQRTHNDISLGSIEGAGTFALRGAHVTTGSRNTSTIVTGKIVDNPPGLSTGGRLTKVGAGTLTLAGANTYSGLTTINAGTVSVTGSIAGGAIVNSGGTLNGTGTIVGGVTINSGGVFAPGLSPGTITIGGLTMSSGAALNFELGATARDRIVLTNNGTISLGGVLNLSLFDGFTPSLGQTFPLFEGSIGSIAGGFSAINAPVFNGLTFTPIQNANTLLLQVVESTTLAADFNFDGTVSSGDLATWRSNFAASGSATHAQGDADGDADVDGTDFLVWQRQLGLAAPVHPVQASVPEPGTGILLPTAATWLLTRRAAGRGRKLALSAA
jgi:autotransporter-associated beta strand protein